MRRKRNILTFSLLGAAAFFYLMQVSFVSVFLAVGDNVPDLLLILTVFVSMRLGQIPGMLFGFTVGLWQDAMIDFYGLNALCKTIAAFATYFFAAERVMLIEKYYFPIMIFFLSVIHAVFFYAIQSLDGVVDFWSLMFHYGLWNSLYSAVTAFVIYLSIPQRILDYVRFNTIYDF